ncbi:hypothetical protein BBD42_00015 [Paenibacillus sp. BIHB 4019]|uniref:Uncharacterized protein n=1 Tax=Paenibacillus sp. BIHB 4019 TaxID=1870819 RepID=A0A1B2DBF9_9BACL|nr:hypothetical protein BBD42_00015 [Paenibacillus sp. BIHB 4019]
MLQAVVLSVTENTGAAKVQIRLNGEANVVDDQILLTTSQSQTASCECDEIIKVNAKEPYVMLQERRGRIGALFLRLRMLF